MPVKTVPDVPAEKVGDVVQILVDDNAIKIEAKKHPNGNWEVTGTKPNR